MNILRGTISKLETSGHMTVVEVDVGDMPIKSIVLETPETASYLKQGNEITVLFKETEVVIGKGDMEISLQNRMRGSVSKIDRGKLLSRLTLDTDYGEIVSIITTQAVDQLNLSPGDNVQAMIKTNEIMLSE